MADQGERSEAKARTSAIYPVLFMFVLSFVACGALVGFQRATAARVHANRQVLFEGAVLAALAVDLGERPSPAVIHRTFMERVAAPTAETAGAYRLMAQERVAAYALPIEGRGFWDTIRGMVGIGADGRSLIGLAFYEQHETPGLGAEIDQPEFRRRFPGLKLLGGPQPLRLVPPGAPVGEGEVHAVTGATQTCTRLETILNVALERWRRAMSFAPPAGQAQEGAAS